MRNILDIIDDLDKRIEEPGDRIVFLPAESIRAIMKDYRADRHDTSGNAVCGCMSPLSRGSIGHVLAQSGRRYYIHTFIANDGTEDNEAE